MADSAGRRCARLSKWRVMKARFSSLAASLPPRERPANSTSRMSWRGLSASSRAAWASAGSEVGQGGIDIGAFAPVRAALRGGKVRQRKARSPGGYAQHQVAAGTGQALAVFEPLLGQHLRLLAQLRVFAHVGHALYPVATAQLVFKVFAGLIEQAQCAGLGTKGGLPQFGVGRAVCGVSSFSTRLSMFKAASEISRRGWPANCCARASASLMGRSPDSVRAMASLRLASVSFKLRGRLCHQGAQCARRVHRTVVTRAVHVIRTQAGHCVPGGGTLPWALFEQEPFLAVCVR